MTDYSTLVPPEMIVEQKEYNFSPAGWNWAVFDPVTGGDYCSGWRLERKDAEDSARCALREVYDELGLQW